MADQQERLVSNDFVVSGLDDFEHRVDLAGRSELRSLAGGNPGGTSILSELPRFLWPS